MICTTLRVERPEGSVLARGMAAQIEQAAPDDAERLDAAGSRAFDIFWMYTTGAFRRWRCDGATRFSTSVTPIPRRASPRSIASLAWSRYSMTISRRSVSA